MLSPLFDPALADKIAEAGIVAVLVIDDAGDAVPLARTLFEGGVGVMELTLRTPAALDALRHIRREVPEMVAGIGTILNLEQLDAAHEAGAAFGVSPGCNPRLRAMAAPYAHLGLRYVPLGGLTAKNAGDYLNDPLIAAIGGSWIAPREGIKAKDWRAIAASARSARGLADARAR